MNITNTNTLFNYNHINTDDMSNGHNEWNNIQPIIRTTMKVLFDVINNQQSQITNLTTETTKLRLEMSTKPNIEDIALLLKNHENSTSISNYQSKFQSQSQSSGMNTGISTGSNSGSGSGTSNRYIMSEIENINNNFISIKHELEKKASIRYVDDNTKRKADKTDVLMLQSSQKNNQYITTNMSKLTSDLCQYENDLNDLRSKCYLLDKTMQEAHSKLNNTATVQDVTHVRDDLLESLKHTVTKENFHLELQKKLDCNELTTRLIEKADACVVYGRCEELERAVTEHERLIVLMQMKSHARVVDEVDGGGGLGLGSSMRSPMRSPMGMSSPSAGSGLNRSGFSVRGQGQGYGQGYGNESVHSHQKYRSSVNTPTRSAYSRHTSPKRNTGGHGSQSQSNSHSSSDENNRSQFNHQSQNQTQAFSLPDHLREGRENGVLTGLLEHVDALGHQLQRVTDENRINGDRISGMEDQLADHTVPLHSHNTLQDEVSSLTQWVEQVSSGELVIQPVEQCVQGIYSNIRQLEYMLDIPHSTSTSSCSYLKGLQLKPGSGSDSPDYNLTVSQHLDDIHSLIELLGTRTTEHSSILNSMNLKHENYNVLHQQNANQMNGLEEQTKTIKQIQDFLTINNNNNTNKLKIGNIDEIVQYIHNIYNTIRTIQNDNSGVYEKMLTIENLIEIDVRNEIDSSVVKTKKVEKRIENIEEKNIKIINRLRSFREEIVHVEKRISDTLIGVTSIINETASNTNTNTHTNNNNMKTSSTTSAGLSILKHATDHPGRNVREMGLKLDPDPHSNLDIGTGTGTATGMSSLESSPTSSIASAMSMSVSIPPVVVPVPGVGHQHRSSTIGRQHHTNTHNTHNTHNATNATVDTDVQVDAIEERLKALQKQKEKILQSKRSGSSGSSGNNTNSNNPNNNSGNSGSNSNDISSKFVRNNNKAKPKPKSKPKPNTTTTSNTTSTGTIGTTTTGTIAPIPIASPITGTGVYTGTGTNVGIGVYREHSTLRKLDHELNNDLKFNGGDELELELDLCGGDDIDIDIDDDYFESLKIK